MNENSNMSMNMNSGMPVMLGSRFVTLAKDTVDYIKLDCQAAEKALTGIGKVSDILAPLEPLVSRGLYDTDYIETVILMGNVRTFRDMLSNPFPGSNINEYLKNLYKYQCTDSTFLTAEQKSGLKDLELTFDPKLQTDEYGNSGYRYESSELKYISVIVQDYITKVLPVLDKHPQSTIVWLKGLDKPIEKIPLGKSVILI